MLCLFPFFTRLIATICDWSTGSTEIKRKCRIVPNEPQTEGTVEQNLKNCRHSCIYVKMQNANVWRIHKWQLDIGTHAIGKSGSLNRIRIFFFYLLDTHLFCFIHSSFPPSLFVFYLKQILFRIFLLVLYPSSNVYLCFEWSLFSCFRVWWPWPTWWDASDWLFYLACCSRFWMRNPFFFVEFPFFCRPHPPAYFTGKFVCIRLSSVSWSI